MAEYKKTDNTLDGQPAYSNVAGGLASTQRQAWKLISGPGPTARTRLLSF